jgi:hypothetical protein
MVDYFSEIVKVYDKDTYTYQFMRDHNKFSAHAPGLKDSLFYLRE